MDLFERLTRVLMRRKYTRVNEKRDRPNELLIKSRSMRSSRGTERKGKQQQQQAEPVVVLPKKFTLRSSGNDVIDGAWFNSALRRSIAEGRVTLS